MSRRPPSAHILARRFHQRAGDIATTVAGSIYLKIALWASLVYIPFAGIVITGKTDDAFIFALLSIILVVSAELLRREVEFPMQAEIIEKQPDIVSHYEEMVRKSDHTVLFTWVGQYALVDADAALEKEKNWIAKNRTRNPDFQMIRLYNPHSSNWNPERTAHHKEMMKELIATGAYHLIPGEFHRNYEEGVELGYADYKKGESERFERGSINFVEAKGDPYVVVCFDTGKDDRHRQPVSAIKRMFERHLNDVGYGLDSEDHLMKL